MVGVPFVLPLYMCMQTLYFPCIHLHAYSTSLILIHQMNSMEKAQESQSLYQAPSTSQQTLQYMTCYIIIRVGPMYYEA